MTAFNDRFWAKVLFKEFIKHYRKLSNEERLADIEASMDALEDLDDSGTSFGTKMVKWSMERVNQYPQASENGKKGGRPKKTTAGAPNGNNGDESANAFGTFSGSHERGAKATLGKAASGDQSAVRTDGKNLGSGKPNAQNDQRRAGGASPLSASTSSSPPARSVAVDVLNLAYAGEFGNVLLSQEQYAQLGIKFGNQQKLNRAIDSLSCQIENGERNPQNHYAELVKWASYREDMEEQKEEENAKPKLSKMEQSWINTFKAIERM